jgi:hypothetical protein
MPDFFLVRFSNRQKAAEQVKALHVQKQAKYSPKNLGEFIASLVRKRPPLLGTGSSGEIIDLEFLARILAGSEREMKEITSEDIIVETLRQDNEAVDVRVSEDIKVELESAGIEFTVLGKFHKP